MAHATASLAGGRRAYTGRGRRAVGHRGAVIGDVVAPAGERGLGCPESLAARSPLQEGAGWPAGGGGVCGASPHDRRCKMVLLGRRAQNVISQISAEAEKLRGELLENISATDLRTCMRVLTQIYEKAERKNGNGALAKFRSTATATLKK